MSELLDNAHRAAAALQKVQRLHLGDDAELAAGIERATLALDPELAQLRDECLEREQKAAWGRSAARERRSGWKGGPPRCHGCKSFLTALGAPCGECGYLDGAGYMGVPAKTSLSERWR